MMKIIFWTAWFFLAATTFAHAGPVAAAIGAIAGAIGSLGAVGQLIIGIGLKVASSLIQRALTKDNEQRQPGVKGQLEVGGDNPLSFIAGTYATAGQLEYVNSWGEVNKTPNAYLTMVMSLSDVPVSGLSSTIWVNGQKCTIDFGNGSYEQGYPVEEFETDGGNNHLWVKFYDGTQTAADPFLLSKFGADSERPWTADMVGRGIAYAIVTAQVNRELFTNVPQVKFVVNGIKLYDIRKDSTAGGSGAHRWNNPATWEFTDNPKVIAYNLIRGITHQGAWVYGGQNVAAGRLPASTWMAAMNECDRLIALASGGSEKQFTAGAEISVDLEPLGIIEELDKSCNGRTVEIGGVYKTHVGAPPLPVYSFTDEDIVVTRDQTYEPFPGLDETYNGVHATYPEPEEGWADKDAPPRYNATFEAADDGRRLIAEVSFPLVWRGTQVQRLMKSMVEEARRFRQHNFFLPPEAWLLEPVVDSVSWSSARNGYVAKTFLIGSMLDHPNCLQEVSLQEVDPADYDWSTSDELPTSVGPLGPIRPPAQIIPGWQVQPATIYDDQGNPRRPAIEVFFDGDMADVRAVRVQVRVAGGENVFDGEIPYGDPADFAPLRSALVSGNWTTPLTAFEVRGKFVPYSARPAEWSFWLPVTTLDIRFGPGDIYPIDIGDLIEDVKDDLEWAQDGARELILEAQRNAKESAEQDWGNFLDKQIIRQEAVAQYKTSKAQWTLDVLVAVNATEALAQRLEQLEVEVDQTIASAISLIQAQITTINGQLTAVVNSVEQVSVQIGNVSAGGLLRMEAQGTISGGWSRIGARAYAGQGGALAEAAWFLDANTNGTSRFVVVSDQFVVMAPNGSAMQSPLVFTNGVLALNVANIGTVNSGLIQSLDGKMQIQLSNSRILMAD